MVKNILKMGAGIYNLPRYMSIAYAIFRYNTQYFPTGHAIAYMILSSS